MVFVDTSVMGLEPFEAAQRLADEGVGCTISPPRIRLVTHLDVSDADIDTAVAAWRTIAPAAR